jgi:acetyl esterase
MEPELRNAMSMLPRLDCTEPVAARSEMNRFVRLSTLLGLHSLTDPGVDVVDRNCPCDGTSTVRVRLYVPRDLVKPAAAVIYFHGGAFLLGDLEIEHPRCLEMAKETKAVVIAVDYRLAPEHPFPAAITDCYAVYLWAMAEADELGIDVSRIAVAGASAGGALAAAVALMSRDRGDRVPAFQLLLYPVTDDRMITPSMIRFVDIQGWNRRNSERMWAHYLGERIGGDVSPYAAPARACDLRGLPPAYVMTVDYDALRDEGIHYAQSLIQAGVSVELHHYPETFHGFDTVAASEVARCARREHYRVLCHALQPRQSGSTGYNLAANHGKSQVVNGR